jgi:iron(III) transport system permease protein
VLNTLIFGLLTTVCAMLIGGILALSLVPGVPGRTPLERLVVRPLYLTPLLTAMGWSWLGSPRSGMLDTLLHGAFGARVTINVVSREGAIMVTALAAAPLPFLLLSDALRGLDSSLLEAARVHGAMPRRVLRRITLPLLLPAGSAVVRRPSPRPALRADCATQFLIDCAVGSNSAASSSGVRPACSSSTIWRRNCGG